MPLIYTEDGEYVFAIDDHGDTRNGKSQWVVYDKAMNAILDRHSYEASRGEQPAPPSPPPAAPSPEVPPIGPSAPVPTPGAAMRVFQVTDASDGELTPRMYSYWSNAWIASDGSIYVFVGHADGHPRFFRVPHGGAVERLGSPLSYTGTAEGWYWDAAGWIYLLDGSRLRHVDPFGSRDDVVFDIGDTHPGCRLWQAHSSDDGQTHSATVQRITDNGPYQNAGTVVVSHGQQEYFPAQGTLDESQITADGSYLIIKEDDDNRVITMGTRDTRLFRNADGALGHSDCGRSLIVGEDDQHGECVLYDLHEPLVPERRRTLFKTWAMGHISVKGNRCLLSDATHLSLVALDGSGVTPLIAHGMVGSDYDHQVQGNLDPTGRVACYMTNHGGERFDVFLLVLP